MELISIPTVPDVNILFTVMVFSHQSFLKVSGTSSLYIRLCRWGE